MYAWIDRVLDYVSSFFRFRRKEEPAPSVAQAQEPPPQEEPPPQDKEEEPPMVTDPPPLSPPSLSHDEQMQLLREKWERERRKKDKFVTPKGRKKKPEAVEGIEHSDVVPAKLIAEKDRAKPEPAIDGALVPENFFIDEHHAGGTVLFEEEESWGQFNFRDTILDQLERYFVYLRRMRRTDKHAYGLYRHVGATLEPYLSGQWSGEMDREREARPYKFTPEEIAKFAADELTPAFKKNRPAFGCVAYGTNPLAELREIKGLPFKGGRGRLWIPKFMYFTKYSRPPAKWQPMTGGNTYGFTVWWDRPHDPHHWPRKYGVPQDFGIWVSGDGSEVKVLKEHFGFDHKKMKGERWEYPYDMKEWAKGRGISVQIYMSHLFKLAVKSCEDIELSVVRVNVHKGDLTAVFGVNPRRLAYFFKDRDPTYNEHGARERIFHFVKPYQRKDGTYVKMQTRGLREFEWAGYHVQLTVPGLHHESLSTFRYGSVDGSKMKEGEDYVDGEQIGQIFEEYIRTGEVKKPEEGL